MAALTKGVSLRIVTDPGIAKKTLDDISLKADELRKPIDLKIAAEGGSSVTAEMNALKESMGSAEGVTVSFNDALKGLGDTAAGVREIELSLAEADNVLLKGERALASSAAAEARSLKTLAAAEDELAASAKTAGDAQETQAAKQDASAGMFAGVLGKLKIAAFGAGAGIVYGTVQAAKFQSELESIHTQAGVAQSQLSSLGTGVLSLAGQVGFNPESLATALYHVESSFASVGITGPAALSLLKTAAEGAAVGHSDLVDTTNALDATIAAGVPGIHNYSQAMGALNAIVGSGDMHMQDLAAAMSTGVMAMAKTYGQNITEVGAALATFGDNNIRGAQAATDLRMAWQAVQVPMKAGIPILDSIGLKSDSLANEMRQHGLTAAIGEFIQHLKASKVPADEWGQYVTQIFGKKAGSGLAVLTSQFDRLQSKFPEMTKGAGQFGQAWQHQSETVSQEWKNLLSGIQALATEQGSVFMPVTKTVLHLLDDFVVALTKGKAPALALAGVIGGLLAGFALKKLEDGVKTSAEGFKGLWSAGVKLVGMFTAETVATEEATAAQDGLNLAFLANPVTLIIAGIVALIAIIVVIATKTKWFQDIWNAAWGFIKKAFDDTFGWIKSHWPLILTILTGPIGLAVKFIVSHWNDIVNGAKSMVGSLIGFFTGLPGRIISALSSLASSMFNIGSNIIWGVIHGVESAVGGLFSYIGNIGKSISNVFSSVLSIFSPSRVFASHGRNIVLGLVAGIKENAPQATGAIADLGRAVSGSLNVSTPAGGLAARGSGNTYTFNVTVSGLVGDAGATGRQIVEAANTYLRQTGQPALAGA